MAISGFLLIDKPTGITSFDVVREVRKKYGEKKVGHSGTLDPLASGLMLVALGDGTKFLEYLIGCTKEYEVVAEFGKVSDTYDAEGTISQGASDVDCDREALEQIIATEFLGKIQQMPPKYSALKVAGKRACDIVRGGGEVELKSRTVEIFGCDVLDFEWPVVRMKVGCGSGTYIRSLVHDLGGVVGSGAYVKELRRTKVGVFGIEEVDENLITIEALCQRCFVCLDLADDEFSGLLDGRKYRRSNFPEGSPVVALYKGKVAGVLEWLSDQGVMKFSKSMAKSS